MRSPFAASVQPSWHRLTDSLYSCHTALLLSFYPITPESPRFLAARGEQEKAAKVLEKTAWMNGKDFPDGVLMTTTDHETSKADAASDGGILELLTQITWSRIGSLNRFDSLCFSKLKI